MNKVGIITTHRANNFGAVLQAFSLARSCQELGADTTIIDWRSPHYEHQYHSAWRMARNPLPAIKHLLWYLTEESKSRQLFDEFRGALPLSMPVYSRRDLEKIEVQYDKFLVGSDQVWNPLNSAYKAEKFDRTFLLDFVKRKSKNAYAASIGLKGINPVSLRSEFHEAWSSFDVITMREYAGAEYVSDVLGKKIDTVLDPVLLHDESFWRKELPEGSFPDKYLFKYNVRGVVALEDFAKKIGNDKGLRIVAPLIPSFNYMFRKGDLNMGPREFLAAIHGSSCVVTSSFHAAAFSVIFGKRLYLIRRFTASDPNSRFDTLFAFARLMPEKIEETKEYEIVRVDCSNADYDNIRKERNISLQKLNGML